MLRLLWFRRVGDLGPDVTRHGRPRRRQQSFRVEESKDLIRGQGVAFLVRVNTVTVERAALSVCALERRAEIQAWHRVLPAQPLEMLLRLQDFGAPVTHRPTEEDLRLAGEHHDGEADAAAAERRLTISPGDSRRRARVILPGDVEIADSPTRT